MAIKGIGGFHLSVDATSEDAVARLRQRKHRYGKPLAIMVRDLSAAHSLCELSPAEEALLQTPAHPIVLACARSHNGIVYDGAVRDINGLNELEDFVSFVRFYDPSHHFSSLGTGARLNSTMIGINIPIRIGKATVMPGDVVLGPETHRLLAGERANED